MRKTYGKGQSADMETQKPAAVKMCFKQITGDTLTQQFLGRLVSDGMNRNRIPTTENAKGILMRVWSQTIAATQMIHLVVLGVTLLIRTQDGNTATSKYVLKKLVMLQH